MNAFKRALNARDNLLRKVKERFLSKLSPEEQQPAGDFLSVFAEHLFVEDWQALEPADFAGCLHCMWIALNQGQHEVFLRAFNPSLDEDGWLCNGTVFIVRQADMPFLVDSLRLELVRQGLPVHLIKSTLLNVARDRHQHVAAVASIQSTFDPPETLCWRKEAVIYLETGIITDEDVLGDVTEGLKAVLADVHSVVNDYRAMLKTLDKIKINLQWAPENSNVDECQAFLAWLADSHFTFLGMREYALLEERHGYLLTENESERQGLFRRQQGVETPVPGAEFFYQSSELLAFSKSASRSSVHRNVYPDYIVIKKFDQNGKVVGEIRILGLFTYAVYSISPLDIPILRRKVESILTRTGLSAVSHDGKNLRRVIESFPRDELFQSDAQTLYETVTGVARISERRIVKLFMRADAFGKFINCIAYVPRDIYNTRVRQKIEGLIGSVIQSTELDSTTHFSESQLARAYMVFRLSDEATIEFDRDAIERGVVDITRGWDDRFETALIEAFGEAKGLQYHRLYSSAFSSSYQENFDARTTLNDIEMFEALGEPGDVAMHLFHPLGNQDSNMRFKVMRLHNSLELSDVIPVLEHLGLRVLGEHPYRITRADGVDVWLHDFNLVFSLPVNIDVHAVSKLFEQAFSAIWHRHTESDAFNRLVLGARLNWREVSMLRAYAAYMKQTVFSYSAEYIADTLATQPEITRNLVALFKSYFDPRLSGTAKAVERSERLKEKILQSLETIENLAEDRILRRYLELISATLRTNYYQKDEHQTDKSYISFKLSTRDIVDIPEPRPKYEIYVYSPRVEGVHLRAASVARGGLRWSDRLQDYRTEVLGLVKAQQVKNAVIVPSGAKGGFVAKTSLAGLNRDEFLAEGIACYQTFIRGLLDLTDNYVSGQLVRPENVVCRDGEDPYLVVAADKGTATFSDIANDISRQYQHWLGDAFASGGSNGYDHKKMGITARGAWVGVQRHFREIGVDIQQQPFTVVGIGDMSGDVFGNGMLLSEKIRLLAAFNHQHILIDPDPDTARSFAERKRLFDLPRSSWSDYQAEVISEGGGIYLRSAKVITVSTQAQLALGLDRSRWTPSELIRAILKAPIDLLWNGGIGTYVKASSESHVEVGDKSNDALRVDGRELRCKVIGEGGNLGLTQKGRVEYSLRGGACNTDFIDNSAGVDCSDHEVNIKILLDEMIAEGDLTAKQRNKLLVEMTDEVADLVLHNNDQQTFALSLAQFQVASRIGEYRRFMHFLEDRGILNRELEFLPNDEQIDERVEQGQALSRPELAVLLSYSKVMLKDEFIQQQLVEVDYLKKQVESAFPPILRKKYKKAIYQHRLLKEIVATQSANEIINNLGITSTHRLFSSTGSSLREIAVAFAVVRDVFAMPEFQIYVKSLDNIVPALVQAEMMTNMARRLRRGTRWFLSSRDENIDPAEEVKCFRQGILKVNACVGKVLHGESKATWDMKVLQFSELGLDANWLLQLAMPENLFSGLSVVEVVRTTGCPVESAAHIFYHFYDSLDLQWFASQVSEVKVESYWQALARESFLDELELQMRNLVSVVLSVGEMNSPEQQLENWQAQNQQKVIRWNRFVQEVKSGKPGDFAMFSVALKELVKLAKTTS